MHVIDGRLKLELGLGLLAVCVQVGDLDLANRLSGLHHRSLTPQEVPQLTQVLTGTLLQPSRLFLISIHSFDAPSLAVNPSSPPLFLGHPPRDHDPHPAFSINTATITLTSTMGRNDSNSRPRGSTITFDQAVLAATAAAAAAESSRPFSGGSISTTAGRQSISTAAGRQSISTTAGRQSFSTTNGRQSVDEKQSQNDNRPAALSFSTNNSRTLVGLNAAGLATPHSPEAQSDRRAVNSIPRKNIPQ
jgi:hypothetical protein